MTKPRAHRSAGGGNPPAAAPSAAAPRAAAPRAAAKDDELVVLDADSRQPLPRELGELIAAARAVQGKAYAPYSGFAVGAAVRLGDGRIFTGANVENASYGLAVCAERTAVLAAVLAGGRQVVAVAVCTSLWPPAAPCGMCRQTLAEFAHDAEVVLCSPSGPAQRTRLSVLLPHAFRPADLEQFAAQTPPGPKRRP
jgi:cytidine deaminase